MIIFNVSYKTILSMSRERSIFSKVREEFIFSCQPDFNIEYERDKLKLMFRITKESKSNTNKSIFLATM